MSHYDEFLPAHSKAKMLIDNCARRKGKLLDVSGCGLNHIPQEIIALKDHLEHLRFGEEYWNENNEIEQSDYYFGTHNRLQPTSLATLAALPQLISLDLSYSVEGD